MVETNQIENKKLVVVGPGSIGSALSASLGQTKANLFLLGKEYHKAHFSKHPVIYKGREGTISSKVTPITIEDLANGEIIPDAVFITLKANFTIPFVKNLEESIPKETPIISLQNGFIAQEIFDKTAFEKVFACVVGFNVFTEKLGVGLQTTDGDLIVGRVSNDDTVSSTDVPPFIVEALRTTAPTSVSENIVSDVWMKAMINSTINPICAIGNLALGQIAEQQSSLMLALWTWKELIHVVSALELTLNPFQGKLFPEMLYPYDLISYGIARI
ncbi:MAG: ketopantoate reductase family protein, partial [Candidatus Heimdallarchaeaceae archaeon]